jgi:hypothetical protein
MIFNQQQPTPIGYRFKTREERTQERNKEQ